MNHAPHSAPAGPDTAGGRDVAVLRQALTAALPTQPHMHTEGAAVGVLEAVRARGWQLSPAPARHLLGDRLRQELRDRGVLGGAHAFEQVVETDLSYLLDAVLAAVHGPATAPAGDGLSPHITAAAGTIRDTARHAMNVAATDATDDGDREQAVVRMLTDLVTAVAQGAAAVAWSQGFEAQGEQSFNSDNIPTGVITHNPYT